MDKLFNGKLDEKKGKTHLVDNVNIFINFDESIERIYLKFKK